MQRLLLLAYLLSAGLACSDILGISAGERVPNGGGNGGNPGNTQRADVLSVLRDLGLGELIDEGRLLELWNKTDLLVSEERAATVTHVSARRGDRRLEVEFVVLYRITGGRIAEVWTAPLDPRATDAFWP